MTRVSPRATIAIVDIDRMTPRKLLMVRNVFGLLRSVKTMITIRIAISSPPTRIPAARARPDQGLDPGADGSAVPARLSAIPS
jgi:hypothetical protein